MVVDVGSSLIFDPGLSRYTKGPRGFHVRKLPHRASAPRFNSPPAARNLDPILTGIITHDKPVAFTKNENTSSPLLLT
jgi:hypothetical protein